MSADKYIYENLTRDNVEAALQSCCDVFAEDEPLSKHVHLTSAQLAEAVRPIFLMNVKNRSNLPQVARSVADGSIAGVLLCSDEYEASQLDAEYLNSLTSENLATILLFLHDLEVSFAKQLTSKLGRDSSNCKVAYTMLRSVSIAHRGHGIAKEMHNRMLEAAGAGGYDAVYSETTNVRSKSLVQKFGGIEWDKIKYADYSDTNGHKPFADMDTRLGDCATLMVTVLNAAAS